MNYQSLDQLPDHIKQLNGIERGPGKRTVTAQEIDVRGKRTHKYNAKRTEIDGKTFSSKLEAERYLVLKARAAAGEIHALQIQPRFELQPAFTDVHGKKHRAIYYVADFQYVENGHVIIEEVKGHETAVWRLKKKLFLYKYGRQVVLRVIK